MYQEAIDDCTRCLQLGPSKEDETDAYATRGYMKSRLGNSCDAMEDYNKAIERDPEHILTYENRSVERKKSGDFEGSWKDQDMARTLRSASKATRSSP